MNSGVPWQVQGVKRQAHDAAPEAASTSDRMAGADPSIAHDSDGGDPYDPIVEAIARLDGRLDQIMAQGRTAISELQRRLDAVDNSVAQFNQERPSQTYPASTSPLDQALLEIAERQIALDRKSSGNGPAHAPTQDLDGLELKLRAITDKVETLRPCGIDNGLGTLRGDLAEISALLKEKMPRHVVENLEAGVRQLVERIDAQRHVSIDAAAFANIEHGLAEVRDVVQALAPMGQVISQVASNDAFVTLSEQVRALTAKVEQASPTNLITNIEQRIALLADALQARNQAMADSRAVEDSIRLLFEKIDRLQLTRSEQAAIRQLEGQIAQLVERVDASGPRLARLE